MNPPLMENEEGQHNFNPVRPREIAVTILVVDDNDAGRYATSRILRHAGYSVMEARTGEEALEAVKTGLDLVVLDVRRSHHS